MYTLFESGSCITLWCDGSDKKDNQPPTKKWTEGSENPKEIMACGWKFLLSGLWFCFVVFRASRVREYDLDSNADLLFAPRQLLVRFPTVLCTWRGNSHLRPWTGSTRRSRLAVPNCYWLILLAGDVETNPGPTKHPCTACSKAVRSNQRGVFCNMCENWTHARCCGIGADEYNLLSELGDSSAW